MSCVAMYLVGLGLKSQNGDQLSCLIVFVVLCSPFRMKPGTYFKLGHGRPLPHTLRFIVFCTSYIATLHGHTQSYWERLQIENIYIYIYIYIYICVCVCLCVRVCFFGGYEYFL